ncbi:MAG TPA: hypothetical protein VNK51_24165 [Bradyrhizobium sp.]|nr:hypothetical protein [Bradyrhizobium sp.]
MKTLVAVIVALCATCSIASANGWRTYRVPESGTSVDIPASIFVEPAGKPGGYGQRFRSSDGSADLTVQAVENRQSLSPAEFLARKNPPKGIIYKRITPNFFVVSSTRRDKIWYNRCNFSQQFVHCVLIDYPASQKQRWDAVVTRISRSLRGG